MRNDWEQKFDEEFVWETDNGSGPLMMFKVHPDGMRQLVLPEHIKEFIRNVINAERIRSKNLIEKIAKLELKLQQLFPN